MSWPRFCRVSGFVGLVVFAVLGFTPLPNLLCRANEVPARLEPAEAIVVLGSGVTPDGVLTQSSRSKAIEGILLYRRGLAPLLVLIGAQQQEAEVRAALARDLGVPAEAILAGGLAWTTKQEADRASSLLRPRAVRRILLVTIPNHMSRARRLFESYGFEVNPAPVGSAPCFLTGPDQRLALALDGLQEFLARLYYRAAGYI